MAEDQGERTEQATDTRRDEFRRRGQVAMTRELGTALIFLISAGLVYILSRYFLTHINEVFDRTYGDQLVQTVRSGELTDTFKFVGLKLVFLLGPVFLISLVIGVASQVVQTGFLQIEDALSPDLNKLNPLNALGRIFSMRGVAELLKSILKMAIVFMSMYFLLKGEVKQIPYLSGYSIEQILSYMGTIIFKLLMGTGIFMLVLALADYFFQRWQIEKDMMMTKQEIKEEMKSREGDPLIKARIRKIQRDVASRRMMQDVPKGDVVITNPTHIAVVLRYSDKLPAPQLIAKGADIMAEKIKEIAKQHNIPILENKPLARTIFKTMKIGQVIPRELFVAVAEVLSYVFRLRRKKSKKSNSTSNQNGARPRNANPRTTNPGV